MEYFDLTFRESNDLLDDSLSFWLLHKNCWWSDCLKLGVMNNWLADLNRLTKIDSWSSDSRSTQISILDDMYGLSEWNLGNGLMNWNLMRNMLSDWILVSRMNELNRSSANRKRLPHKTTLMVVGSAWQNNRIMLFELAGFNNEWLLSSHSTTIDAAPLGRQVGGCEVVFLDQGLGNSVHSDSLNAFQVLRDQASVEFVCVLLYPSQRLVECHVILVSVNVVYDRWALTRRCAVVSHLLDHPHQSPYHWTLWSLLWYRMRWPKFAVQPHLRLPFIIKSYLLTLRLKISDCVA